MDASNDDILEQKQVSNNSEKLKQEKSIIYY